MRVFRSLLSPFLFILIFISLSCFLPPQVKAETNKQNLTAVSGPKVGEVTLYWQMADSEDNYHLVYGREKDKFEYGALRVGKITSFNVRFLSPGTTYYFALVPLMGERPLYTTDSVKAIAQRPVEIVEVTEESLVKPEPSASMPQVTPNEKLEVPIEPENVISLEPSLEPKDEGLEEKSDQGGDEARIFYQEKEGYKTEEPICQGFGSNSEGWYWLTAKEGSESDLIRKDKCESCYAFCKGIDSSSDGWYSSCDGRLIVRASCKSGSNM